MNTVFDTDKRKNKDSKPKAWHAGRFMKKDSTDFICIYKAKKGKNKTDIQILFTVPNMILHLLSGFLLPSALLPHEPATFADKADSSESALPGFLLLLYSHFSKQRFCLHL